jgi:hypothetical protein
VRLIVPTLKESSPFGEQFTCPASPLGAVATKKTRCASMKARSLSSGVAADEKP